MAKQSTSQGNQEALEKTESQVFRSADGAPEIVSDLTVITAIDAEHAEQLKYTWLTWMKFKQELREIPIIVIHDARFDPHAYDWEVPRHSQVRFVPWTMDEAETQRERMVTSFVKIPAEEVKTAWYLKLDADTLATQNGPWIESSWFGPDDKGRLPVYVSSPWGYTKPVDAIARLDDWADCVDELREFHRLELPFDAAQDCLPHPRIISWCFFGNTAWTRQVAAYAPGRLPIPSHDTYLFYCAARRGDHAVRVRMKDYGWDHISSVRRLTARDQSLLAPGTAM